MKDSPQEQQHPPPTLRLSKFKGKSNKLIPKSNEPQRLLKRRRKRRKSKRSSSDSIPIPSFSPVSPIQKRVCSINLEETPSPVKQKPKTPPIPRCLSIILENDDDDDDDFLPSPVFTKSQTSAKKAPPDSTIDKKNAIIHAEKPEKIAEETAKASLGKGVKRKQVSQHSGPSKDAIIKEKEDMKIQNKENHEKHHNHLPLPKKLKINYNEETRAQDATNEEKPVQPENVSLPGATTPPQNRPPPKPPQPTPNTLVSSIDFLFGNVEDQESVTVRDVVCGLEDIFGVTLSKDTKALVRNRLTDLVHGKVKPMDVFQKEETEKSGDKQGDFAALLASVDRLFVDADKDTVTVGNILRALEAEHGVALTAQGKKAVVDHLTELAKKRRTEMSINKQTLQVEGGAQERTATTTKDNKANAKPNAGAEPENAEKGKGKEAGSNRNRSEKVTEKLKKQPPKQINAHDSKRTINVVEEEVGDSTKKQDPPARKKRDRTQKAKVGDGETQEKPSADQAKNKMLAGDDAVGKSTEQKKPAPKRPRKRAKKGTCALCTTCSCSNGTGNLDTTETVRLADFSKSDAQIERALKRRLQKLEKTTNWYEDLTDQVRREYKKHRRVLVKKQEEKFGVDKDLAFGQSRFLPDADEWDSHLESFQAPPIVETQVLKARGTLFACHANFQPTLTQMLGGSEKENPNDTNDDQEGENANSAIPLDEEEGNRDALNESKGCPEESLSQEKVIENSQTDDNVEAVEVTDEENSNPVDHVHRLSWLQGERIANGEGTSAHGSGLWAALTAGKQEGAELKNRSDDTSVGVFGSPNAKSEKTDTALNHDQNDMARYDSLWDHLFDNDTTPTDDGGLDHLLNLFQTSFLHDGATDQELSQSEQDLSREPCIDSSMLTPRRLSIAKQIEKKIQSDSSKYRAIEKTCPNWRENIRFALAQGDEGDVKAALENVQRSRKRLDEAKRKILESIQRQEVALDLFQTTLGASLEHLARTKESDETTCDNNDDAKESANVECAKVAS